jgi:hypothetical protein
MFFAFLVLKKNSNMKHPCKTARTSAFALPWQMSGRKLRRVFFPATRSVTVPEHEAGKMSGATALALLTVSVIFSSFTFLYSIDDVAGAMRAGNAAEISKFFDSRVDLTFPDKGSNYSKSQAEMILKDFFSTNQVKGFVVKHKGENKDGSQFCIGVLQTKVRDYRTRFYLKKKGEQQYLQEIAFEVHE